MRADEVEHGRMMTIADTGADEDLVKRNGVACSGLFYPDQRYAMTVRLKRLPQCLADFQRMTVGGRIDDGDAGHRSARLASPLQHKPAPAEGLQQQQPGQAGAIGRCRIEARRLAGIHRHTK